MIILILPVKRQAEEGFNDLSRAIDCGRIWIQIFTFDSKSGAFI